MNNPEINSLDIAIVGMAGRFPKAKNIDEFWQNLRDGVESISVLSEAELIAASVDKNTINNPNHVKSASVLEDIDKFDASFFGFSPREAETTDPQNRVFLECAWEALENAGYNPQTYDGLIGVFAGASPNSYVMNNVLPHNWVNKAEVFGFSPNNYQGFLTTNVSYKLNLKGPSLSVQTFCSTSLVAVHLACQSLLNEECDMMLAGGVSINSNPKTGYIAEEGGILSPDGHCRSFDAKAQGTIFGSGVGVVVLKRLEDAIAENDCIHAVIKGSAINNDGSLKASYTAPSVDGQADVIIEGLAAAGVEADTISYIEAHGTGTNLGDPIEIAALTEAFQSGTGDSRIARTCAIGSVKSNLGHLDAAAGIAGLIKTVLALKHKQIPPSLHFEQPNPKIDFANSPFYVNTKLTNWETKGNIPRRAGLNSLGFGGTNAHVVLEEAIPPSPPLVRGGKSGRQYQLLLLSSKTETALDTATQNLANHLKDNPEINLGDAAYTLQVGRQTFNHRRMVMCENATEAVQALSTKDPYKVFSQQQELQERPVVFMFSGQGSQYFDMGRELYETEPVFRENCDRCFQILEQYTDKPLKEIIFTIDGRMPFAPTTEINQTEYAQTAIFVIEYALAQLWMSWGIQPKAMLGHSIGEYVAACLSGVFSLEDALAIVAQRAKLMQQMPTGAMLAVSLSESEIQSWLNSDLEIAVINNPSGCVISAKTEAIEELESKLASQGIDYRRLHTSHAFHSSMMQPMAAELTKLISQFKLNAPQISYLSNVTGDWITPEEATNPSYWSQHLCQTVRFSQNLERVLENPQQILLEIGAGKTLKTLATRHPNRNQEQIILSSLRHPQDEQSDSAFLMNTLGKLWLAGAKIDWNSFHKAENCYRLPLPTYPFARQRYWIDPPNKEDFQAVTTKSLNKKTDVHNWFYLPSWKRTLTPSRTLLKPDSWLVFLDHSDLGAELLAKLEQNQQKVIVVKVGQEFQQLDANTYSINPSHAEDYHLLITKLHNQMPSKILHLWNIDNSQVSEQIIEEVQEKGFYSLLYLTQALSKHNWTEKLDIVVISNNMQSVTGTETINPAKATILACCNVIPQEYPNIRVRSIDCELLKFLDESISSDRSHLNSPIMGDLENISSQDWGARGTKIAANSAKLSQQLWQEITASSQENIIAYRGANRWVQIHEPVQLETSASSLLKPEGVYLITGGLGGVGLVIAEYLAKTVQAKLVLIGRSSFPAKQEWREYLEKYPESHPINQKIQKIKQLEDLGAEILTISADVANLEQMEQAIALAEEKFGAINGVFHGAGVLNSETFPSIADTTKTECNRKFRPKINGLLVLEKVMSHKNLDFCLLLSSLSSMLGGLGYLAYSAGNLFMDAFTHNQTNATPWISVNWDNWLVDRATDSESLELAIAPNEGMDALDKILACPDLAQIIVSTGDLQARIEKWTNIESVSESPKTTLSTYSRPNLSTAFVAPRNEIEQTLADIWQEFLGIELVGIHDDFFDLGGDSLIITRLISRIRQIFQIELSFRSLFSETTIAALAQTITTLRSLIRDTDSPEIGGEDLEEGEI